MRIDFEGQRALVTGAGHGIGRGIAQALSRLGARTLAVDVNADGLGETAAGAEGPLQTAVVDVTDAESIGRAVAAFGPADILVHSAGGVCGQVGKPA